MPAQSPTLSPTLSAITAGLRGSSSGMPASTLPTRSAPTSAPLVKMPPPRRAKIEISEPPKARPTSGWIMWCRPSFVRIRRPVGGARQEPVEAGHAEQAQADDQHAGDRAAAERDRERLVEAGARGFGRAHVRAHRHVHADVAREAREHRADQEAARRAAAERPPDDDEQDDADDADRRVLAVEIGLGAGLDRRGDLLHARIAGRLGQIQLIETMP